MKLFGGAVGIAGLTGSTVAQSAQTSTVVDLADEGITDGDVIDDYLEAHFDSGVEVRVPEGEYEYHGSGFGGTRSNAAVVGAGEVILTNEAGSYGETIEAESGVVEIRNLTLRGESGPEKTRFRLEAQSDGHVLIDNFNLPDGNVDPGDARGFYVPGDHAGVIEIRNCYIANFSNNGIYADGPGQDGGQGGQVIVENCFVHNNNITGIRLGSTDSVARNCLVLNDGAPPAISEGGAINMRGIRIREPGDDITIEGCEVIHSYEGAGAPIELHEGAEGGSGTITDTLIRNNTGTPAIHGKGSTADAWSANNVSIVGDGDLGYPSNFSGVCVGDGCPVPTGTDPQGSGSTGSGGDSGGSDGSDTDGSDGTDDADNGSATGGSDDGSTDDSSDGSDVGSGGTELSIVTQNAGMEYAFTATGAITPLYERGEYDADTEAPADEATENADGTWTANGVTGGGSTSGDSYHYEGTVTDFSMSGDPSAMTILADGQEVTVDELVDADAVPGDDGTDSDGDDSGSDGDDSGSDGGDSGSDGGDGSGSDDTRQKTVIFDGTVSDTVAVYSFRVSGDVAYADSISTAPADNRFDELEDVVDGNQVNGVLGKGIDGYRYSGDIVEMEFDGAAAVTIDSE